MKFTLIIFCALFSLSPILAEEIKIYTWEAFLSQNMIDEFTKKTGHTVTQYYYDSEIERNAIIMNGQGDKFDIVILDHIRTLEFGPLGKINKLTQLNIANQQYNSLASRKSCGGYGIPYAKGTMGIIHRSSISVSKIDSWMNLLIPAEEHIGGTVMLKDDVDTTAIALLALGIDPFTEDKDDLKKAYELLIKQSKMILKYSYPISYLTADDASPNLSLALAYSGDLFNIKALSGHQDWEFVLPKEGTLLFVDCLSLPAGMPVKVATTAFLAYINDPKIAAKNAQEIWFSTTNEAAVLLTSEKYQNDSELSPENSTLDKSYHYQPISAQGILLRNRIISTLHTSE